MKIKGWDLDFFNSGEWQVCDERLKDLEKVNRRIGCDGYNPGRAKLFEALRLTSFEQTRCIIIGQDPYPGREAVGYAFGVCGTLPVGAWPPTLRTLFDEYERDLHYPRPTKGDLTGWTASNGVLLWNAIPSCRSGHSLSHDWPEWECLTHEIVRRLAEKGVVYALLGNVARRYTSDISLSNSHIVVSSHPSPRGSRASNTPFIGSRIFSTINDRLNDISLSPIDWKLP